MDSLKCDLSKAIEEGNVATAEKLIATCNDDSFVRALSDSKNYLADAIDRRRIRMAKLLLRSGSDIIKKDKTPGDSPLHAAVSIADLELILAILERDANVDIKNGRDETPLHLAAKNSFVTIAVLLLKKNASVIALNNLGQPPLYQAIHMGRPEMTGLLLRYMSYADAESLNRESLLFNAIVRRNVKIVEHLLNSSAFVDLLSRSNKFKGYSPLHVATLNGDVKIVELLLRKGANVNATGKYSTPLHLAAKNECEKFSHDSTVYSGDASNRSFLHDVVEEGSSEILEMLLEYGADVDALHVVKEGYTLLHHAANIRRFNVARILIRYGANVHALDGNEKFPISYAVNRSDFVTTQLLINRGAQIKYPWNVLERRPEEHFWKVIEILVSNDSGIDIIGRDMFGRTALNYITCDHDVPSREFDEHRKRPAHKYNTRNSLGYHANRDLKRHLAETLLRRGADVNARTPRGWSPMHCAAHGSDDELVRILLEHKADVNTATNIEMYTPLHLAAEDGNEPITRMLIDAGARVDVKDASGESTLHFACRGKNKEVVATLLELGVKIDDIDDKNFTPLHVAAMEDSVEVVETLLEASADVEHRANDGRTALQRAVKYRNGKIMKELLDYGVKFNFYDLMSSGSNDTDNVMRKHIVKLKALNMYVDRWHLETINFDNEFIDFQLHCEREVELMKGEKIFDTNISYYDILRKSINEFAILNRNEMIENFTKSFIGDQRFPTYSKMMYYHLKRGQKRGNLLNSSLKPFEFFVGYTLPELVSLQVLSNLSDDDLKNLVKAGHDSK